MQIAVIGTGYVGLVSGVCLAEIGHHVTCVDVDAAKITKLNNGEVPLFEPGLAELINKNTAAGKLAFTTNIKAAVATAKAIFIAVGTPPDPTTGHADMRFVLSAAADIGRAMNEAKTIIVKSTVPVGTSQKVAEATLSQSQGHQVFMASNPEFLREGAAIGDFMQPDRIVVGTDAPAARQVLDEIYAPMTSQGAILFHTSTRSAELIKYAANGFLAAKISFINEMAELCEAVGAEVEDVAKGIGLDPRIGNRFLQAGPGYGGSCFPKDTQALAGIAAQAGVPLEITRATIAANERAKARMVTKIEGLLDGHLQSKRIAIFGITFKPETDDVRDAPALTIVPALQAAGASLVAVDPEGRKQAESLLPGLGWALDPYEAATDADLVVILTEWNVFKTLDLQKLQRVMRQPRLADLRNIFERQHVLAAGFTHYDRVGSSTA